MRRPSGAHTGSVPPPAEIWVRPPGPGNGRTNTSAAPDSIEVYATQRPSGENLGMSSSKGVASNGFDVVSPLIARYQMSRPVRAESVRYSSHFPSGDRTASERCSLPVCRCSTSASALRSNGCHQISSRRLLSNKRRKITRRPSGLHSGRSDCTSVVRRIIVPDAMSMMAMAEPTSARSVDETAIRVPSGENRGNMMLAVALVCAPIGVPLPCSSTS